MNNNITNLYGTHISNLGFGNGNEVNTCEKHSKALTWGHVQSDHWLYPCRDQSQRSLLHSDTSCAWCWLVPNSLSKSYLACLPWCFKGDKRKKEKKKDKRQPTSGLSFISCRNADLFLFVHHICLYFIAFPLRTASNPDDLCPFPVPNFPPLPPQEEDSRFRNQKSSHVFSFLLFFSFWLPLSCREVPVYSSSSLVVRMN